MPDKVIRLLLVCLAVGVVIQAAVLHARTGEEPPRYVSLRSGEPLPRVLLSTGSISDKNIRHLISSDVPIGSIFPRSCGVLIFFDVACAECEVVAPKWAGIDSISRGGASLPVTWVAVGANHGAADLFVRRYHLHAPWYSATSMSDLARLGVYGVPTVYLINGSTFFGELGQVPADIEDFPPVCKAHG